MASALNKTVRCWLAAGIIGLAQLSLPQPSCADVVAANTIDNFNRPIPGVPSLVSEAAFEAYGQWMYSGFRGATAFLSVEEIQAAYKSMRAFLAPSTESFTVYRQCGALTAAARSGGSVTYPDIFATSANPSTGYGSCPAENPVFAIKCPRGTAGISSCGTPAGAFNQEVVLGPGKATWNPKTNSFIFYPDNVSAGGVCSRIWGGVAPAAGAGALSVGAGLVVGAAADYALRPVIPDTTQRGVALSLAGPVLGGAAMLGLANSGVVGTLAGAPSAYFALTAGGSVATVGGLAAGALSAPVAYLGLANVIAQSQLGVMEAAAAQGNIGQLNQSYQAVLDATDPLKLLELSLSEYFLSSYEPGPFSKDTVGASVLNPVANVGARAWQEWCGLWH